MTIMPRLPIQAAHATAILIVVLAAGCARQPAEKLADETARKAIEVADAGAAAEIESRLALYESGRPFRME